MTDQTAGLVSCQTTQLPHTRSAECANATEFRRVPTMAERLGDSRLCGHTPEQHRHDDGQAADARSQDRAIRELEAELAGARGKLRSVERERDRLADELDSTQQVATFRQGVIDLHGAELGAAGEVLAVVRDAAERIDRALAVYDTAPEVTPVEPDNDPDFADLEHDLAVFAARWYPGPNDLTGTWCVMPVDQPPGNSSVPPVANHVTRAVAHHIAELHNRTFEEPADETPPPSSVPPRRAQEDPTAEALAEHLTAYQWYSKPEFPLLHEPSAHREHIYNSDCAICRGDWVRVAGVALAFVLAERKG